MSIRKNRIPLQIFRDMIYKDKYYTIKDTDDIKKFCVKMTDYVIKSKDTYYYNIPCSFDIETTSFFEDAFGNVLNPSEYALLDQKDKGGYTKKAIMYIWMFGICGMCIIGRTWEEYITLCDMLQEYLDLNDKTLLTVYVHSLSYEFQFIKNLFSWEKIFATKPYEPLYVQTDNGFLYKCSYRLTGKNLAKMGEGLLTFKMNKKVGDLDYNIIRNSHTKLDDTEMGYCINDIKVVMCHIMEQIEIEKKIYKIPLTKTGYVRRDIEKECLYDTDKKKAAKKQREYYTIRSHCILDTKVYQMCLDAFQGGFVHSGALWAGELVHDAESDDIISAYPAGIVAEYYPMSAFKERKLTNNEELYTYLKYYCCLFTITFYNIESTFEYEHYISRSKCLELSKDFTVNNGRIVSADMLTVTITEIDFKIISEWYKWSKATIRCFYTAMRGYLPTPIVKATLSYYKGKTTLKGVEGMELEYLLKKENLNSIFGCMVTAIYRPDITLDQYGLWHIIDDPEGLNTEITKYNEKYNRCLYYPWGVWITAHVRKRICLDIIDNIGESYLYSDTDSVKFKDPEKFRVVFEQANKLYLIKLKAALKYHNIPEEELSPVNNKGERKILGMFEVDGHYKTFKAYGAKRYIYEDEKGFHITVAGLPKAAGRDYMLNNLDPFLDFKDGMTIPAINTGKLTHTYVEDEIEGTLTDYQGNTAPYHEHSYINLSPCEFTMSIAQDYIDFLKTLQSVKYNIGHLKYT